MVDSFWRAAAYCLHPRVIGLSFAPLLVVVAAAALLGWLFWQPSVATVRAALDQWQFVATVSGWFGAVGLDGVRGVLAPLIVLALAVPAFVVASLLFVALLMTPAIVRLVASRRFPALERREGGSLWQGVAWSLGCTVVALFALVVSVPLWFIPPLVLVVPPLIWGWLTYRVFAFDVLAVHASRDERRRLLEAHRWPLLTMGVVAGYLGAAPALLWAVSALALVLAPVLILVSIWIYTVVFAFAALWFAHYLLAALEVLRLDEARLAVTGLVAPRIPPAASPSTTSTPATPAVSPRKDSGS